MLQCFIYRYNNNLKSHLNVLACQHMPKNLQSLDNAIQSVKPNLDSYVFLNVKKDVAGLLVEVDENEDL